MVVDVKITRIKPDRGRREELLVVDTNAAGEAIHERLALKEGAPVGEFPAVVKVEERSVNFALPCAAEAVSLVQAAATSPSTSPISSYPVRVSQSQTIHGRSEEAPDRRGRNAFKPQCLHLRFAFCIALFAFG
eukprot:g13815.t1